MNISWSDGKSSAFSKFKAFADDKINVTQTLFHRYGMGTVKSGVLVTNIFSFQKITVRESLKPGTVY